MSRFALLSRLGLVGLAGILISPALLAAGISTTNKYAWSENAGWLNFNSANNSASVQVYADHLEGYVWAENIGWIRLGSHSGGGAHTYGNTSNTDYGVNHNGAGGLSGYAWSENAGWINFQTTYSQVTIDATGVFDGYAWSENVGYIHFRNASPAYQVAVQRDPQTITNFNPPATGVVGGSATLSATGGGSGNPVVFGATTPAICTVGGATVSYGAAGTCTVTADQAGNLLYLPAAQVTGNILVGLANVSCGESWTPQTSSLTKGTLRGIAWSGSQFVAVGYNSSTGTDAILTSPDGITWTPQTSGLEHLGYDAPLVGIAWSGSQFVAVGYAGHDGSLGGVILTSPDGITWTPRTSGLASGQLKNITWSGSQFVAVGYDASAGITGAILTSPNGITWTPQTSGISGVLYDIAWSGSQFVAVGRQDSIGAGPGAILTSPDGITWTLQTSSLSNGTLGRIAWSGSQFVAVGGDVSTGITDAILTSPNGITWTPQTSGLASRTLSGIAWSGSQFVAVGEINSAQPVILTSACPWGDDFALANQRWTMIGLPAAPTTPTVAGVFGGLTGAYDTDWVVWWRNAMTDQNVKLPSINAAMAQGIGYWLKSYNGPATVSLIAADATPLVTTNANCPSTVGCYEITLATPAANRYNLVGFPLPYPVGWWDVRVEVNGTNSYTLNAAETYQYLASTYWIWNGNGYDVYDDVTPGMIGVSQPWQGLWVKVLSNGVGQAIKLLIPAIPKVSQAPAPHRPANVEFSERAVQAPTGWQRLVDWLIPTALATPPDRAQAIGWREREDLRNRHGRAIQEGREWYVRLIVEEPTLGLRDRNNVFGQLEDAEVGYDRYDLPELVPAFKPYLTVVFPHADWGVKASNYASDYRPPNKGVPAASWRFEVRGDVARAVRLRWEGPAAILSHSVLMDEATGRQYPASDATLLRDGLPVNMTGPVSSFTWRYSGKPNK